MSPRRVEASDYYRGGMKVPTESAVAAILELIAARREPRG